MSEAIIGVDLGGTRVRAGRLDHNLDLLERHETLTDDERGLDATLATIKDMVRAVLPKDGSTVAGIGISAPGPLNPLTGVVVAPPVVVSPPVVYAPPRVVYGPPVYYGPGYGGPVYVGRYPGKRWKHWKKHHHRHHHWD